MIRQDTRLLAVLVVFLAFLVTWLVLAGRPNPRDYRRSSVPEEHAPLPRRPLQAETERRPIVVSKWLRELLDEAGIPVVQDTEDDTGEADRGCILHGKLVWENKPWLPLQGVEVRLTDAWLDTIVPTEKRKARDPLLLPPKSTTDKFGKFVLRSVPTRKTLFLLVRDDDRTLMVKKLRHLPLPGQMLNLYEIEVPEQGTLRGRVVNERGRALRETTVRAISDPMNRGPLRDDRMEAQRVERSRFFRARGQTGPSVVPRWVTRRDRMMPFPSTLTTSDGTFVLHGARAGWTVLVIQGRHGAALRKVDVEANKTTDIGEVIALGGDALRAYVADDEGRPVASAQVSVEVHGLPITMEPVTTDAGGFFDCGYIPGDQHTVFVKTRDSQLWRIATPCRRPKRHPWAQGETVYEFSNGLSGLVTIVDPAGRPVSDAMAALSHLDSRFTRTWVPLPRHVTAGESPGNFVLHDVSRRHTLRLVVAAPAYAPAVLRLVVEAGKGPFQAGGLQVHLRPIFPVRFQVRGANDQPIANASVSVMFQRPSRHPLSGTDDHLLTGGGAVLGHTDVNGVLETPHLWRSPAWFAAWHPDYGLTPTELIWPLPGMVVPIRLRLTGRVDGKLTFQDSQPGSRWIIRARPAAYFSTAHEKNPFFKAHRTVTSPDGSFYFNDLFEGICYLSLHRLAPDPGRGWAFRWPEGEQSEVGVVAGMAVLHEWDVPRDGFSRFHITGMARLDGRPLVHAVVRVHVPYMTDLESVIERTKHALNRALEERFEGKVDDRGGKLTERIHRLSLLYRRMRWTRKVPPAERFPEGVLVPAKHPIAAVKTDALGKFDIALRRPGRFELCLADPQGKQELASVRTTLTGRRGKDKGKPRAEVHFNVQTGSLRLTLTTHETFRIRRRTVRLTQEPAGAVFRLRTNDQGDVLVRRIPAGKYRLTIDGQGVVAAGIKNPVVNITAGTLNVHHAYTDPYVPATESVKKLPASADAGR